MQITPYLTFPGTARDAITFYADALGGTIENIMTIGNVPDAGPVSDGYKDKLGSSDGVTKMKLKSGEAGKAKVLVKAKGDSLVVPTLPLTLPVVVQLLVDDGVSPQCWQTTFTSTPKKNDAVKFKAKE